MAKLNDLQGRVDGLDRDGVLRRLREVSRWPVYYSQAETMRRKDEALAWIEKLQGPEAEEWTPQARSWLHKLVSDYQQLCEAW